MIFEDQKACLVRFEHDCRKFRETLNGISILNSNFDEYEHDLSDDFLNKNSPEWRKFVENVTAYFQVYPNTSYQAKFDDITRDQITPFVVDEMETMFHKILIELNVKDAKSAKENVSNVDKKWENDKPDERRKIFIVHGHDAELKNEIARFLEKQGLEVIILHEQVSGGKTILEKIESYSNVGYGIVLYTPCDSGKRNGADDSAMRNRARQNVVWEHGYLTGKLGRERVCAIVKGDIEKPSDIDGLMYVLYDDYEGWQKKLAKEMRSVGYRIDL